jgi:hypothetical protein
MLGNFYNYFPVRPQKAVNVDSSYFVEAWREPRAQFGFGYRETTTNTNTHYGGNQLVGKINSADDKIARLHRDGNAGASAASTQASTWETCTRRTASR